MLDCAKLCWRCQTHIISSTQCNAMRGESAGRFWEVEFRYVTVIIRRGQEVQTLASLDSRLFDPTESQSASKKISNVREQMNSWIPTLSAILSRCVWKNVDTSISKTLRHDWELCDRSIQILWRPDAFHFYLHCPEDEGQTWIDFILSDLPPDCLSGHSSGEVTACRVATSDQCLTIDSSLAYIMCIYIKSCWTGLGKGDKGQYLGIGTPRWGNFPTG